MSAKKDLPHSGHRERMRRRFSQAGMSFSSFPPHEVLEMLLFFTHRRRNTNPSGHKLIERFGSVDGVLSADPAEISDTEGIGDTAAARFACWNELLKRIEK